MEATGPTELPPAYAVSLWLRDLGLGPAQIADALDVAVEALDQLLRIAELKRSELPERSRSTSGPRGVAVFVEGADDGLVEDAAGLAGSRGGTLHLLARRRDRGRSQALWIATARRVLSLALDVNLVAAVGSRAEALRQLAHEQGPVTVLSSSHDEERRPVTKDPSKRMSTRR